MSVSSAIKTITPWLATAAGIAVPGSAPLIQMAASALSKGLGATVKADSQSISDAIMKATETPEQLAAVKKIDDDFAVQMRSLGIQELTDLAKINEDDREGARAMQEKTQSKMPAILAALAVVTLAFCIYLVGFRTLPPSGHDAIILLLGAVIGITKDVYGYTFGSSAGSDRKTELLAQAPPIGK